MVAQLEFGRISGGKSSPKSTEDLVKAEHLSNPSSLKLPDKSGVVALTREQKVSDFMQKKWRDDPAWREHMKQVLEDHEVSQETRDKISEKGKITHSKLEYKLKMSEIKGGAMGKVLLLHLRGGTAEEITQITGLSLNQVHRAIEGARASGILKRPTKEEASAARSAARLGKPLWSKGKEHTEDEFKNFKFAKRLLESGFLTQDLTHWVELHKLYEEKGREMPHDFAERLILEAKLLSERDSSLQIPYGQIGRKVDPLWFQQNLRQEKQFISTQIRGPKVAEIAKSYGVRMEGIVRWLIGGSRGFVVEDVMQDVYTRMLTNPSLKFFDDSKEEEKYLFYIIRSTLIDQRRVHSDREKKVLKVPFEEDSGNVIFQSPSVEHIVQTKIDLEQAVKSAKEYAPAALYQAAGFTNKVAAVELGMNESTASNQVSKWRRDIHKIL